MKKSTAKAGASLSAIPDDLTDYKDIAKRLGVTTRTLRKMATRGDFTPTIYMLTPQHGVVSSAEVEEWFPSRDIKKLEHRSTLRAEWVDAEARKLKGRTG